MSEKRQYQEGDDEEHLDKEDFLQNNTDPEKESSFKFERSYNKSRDDESNPRSLKKTHSETSSSENNDSLPSYEESMRMEISQVLGQSGHQTLRHPATPMTATSDSTNTSSNNGPDLCRVTPAPYVHFPHPRSNPNFPGGQTNTYEAANHMR